MGRLAVLQAVLQLRGWFGLAARRGTVLGQNAWSMAPRMSRSEEHLVSISPGCCFLAMQESYSWQQWKMYFEEEDASSDNSGVACNSLERQSKLVWAQVKDCAEKSCLLWVRWFWLPDDVTYHKRKISSPHCFLSSPLVAKQDSVLMTSLYSLCFLPPCPTHAFFFNIIF